MPSPVSGSAARLRPGRRDVLKGVGFAALGALGALGLSGCGDPRQRLSVSGASTIAPPTETIAHLFNALRSDFRCDVSSGGTGYGLRSLRGGSSDVAMLARKLSQAERDGLEVRVAAYDGIAIIAHPDTPLPGDMSVEECRRLASGKTRPAGVVVVQKPEGQGTRQAFAGGLGLEPAQLHADAEAGSNGQMVLNVSRTAGAVGYVSHVDALAALDAGIGLRIIHLNGVPPSLETVASGAYPIIRPLAYAYHAGPAHTAGSPGDSGVNGLRRSLAPQVFVDFATGPEGRKVFADHGFAPVREG